MICVLFIACRMRIEFLSNGLDNPQMWVQNCMYGLTFAVLANAVLALFVPLVSERLLTFRENACDLEKLEQIEGESKALLYILTAVRYILLFALYGGLAGVIVGTCTYLPPGATELSVLPAPAPAEACTMILSFVFFSAQLVIVICQSYVELTGCEIPKAIAMIRGAANTVEFAPMLAILLLSARMRALQHEAQPQLWAQNCMYFSTGGLCLTTLMSIAVPVALGGTMQINSATKECTFALPDPRLGYVFVALRYFCMMCFYGGVVGVAGSILVFQAPGGAAVTLPVSPTLECVLNLTFQFFFVYLIMTVMLTVSELSGGRAPLETWRLFAAIEACKSTLVFAPMLSILFVTTRMYALMLTDKKGSPQAWVQDGMYMATWSTLVSFVMCFAAGLVMDKVDTDADGNVVGKFSKQSLNMTLTGIRYFTMLLLYGGMVTVMVGLLVMTPETANGHGALPLVTDALSSTPLSNPPPGPAAVTSAGQAASMRFL
jgi:hypothetical protein